MVSLSLQYKPAKTAEPGAVHGHRGTALLKTIKLIGPVPVSLSVHGKWRFRRRDPPSAVILIF
jgi:hypothetical protein